MDNLVRIAKQKIDLLLAGGLCAGALLLYMRTLAPTMASIYDDSTEFPLVVYRLAIAHPTGYPLYTVLGKLFTLLLPVRDIAYRLNMLSALCAAGAVAMLYLASRRLGVHPVAAISAGGLLAVSPVFWSQAIIAEVYALNTLFVAMILALAIAYGRSEAHRLTTLLALAFSAGLSLTHHRTIVLLFLPLLLYIVLSELRAPRAVRLRLTAAVILKLVILFALPSLLYAYIPLRGMAASSIDGTYQNTLRGFTSWILGSSYTIFLRSNPLNQPALSASAYLALLMEQFSLGGLILAVIGAGWLFLRRGREFLLLTLAGLMFVVFVHFYHVADAPVFLIPSFVVVALAGGAGVHVLVVATFARVRDTLSARLFSGSTAPASTTGASPSRFRLAAALLLASLVFTGNLKGHVQAVNRSHDWAVQNYAIDVLSQPLERRATIVGILGEMTLLNYYQEVHEIRPDIQTIAADGEDDRLSVVDRLMQAGQPVYLTRPLASLAQRYALRSVGPLIQVVQPATMPTAQVAAAAPQAVFGERIALLAYRLGGLTSSLGPQAFPEVERNGQVEAGGRLRLTLTWQSLQPMQQNYHLTVRLKSPTGRLIWQRDAAPVHDAYPTSAWRPGETVSDVHDLMVPVGTPPGLYDIDIGLYDPANLQLLPVSGRPGLLTIGPVSVVRPDEPVNPDDLPTHSPEPVAGLTIPGGRFDYSLQQLGIQHILRSNLQNEFTLYGYGVSPATLVPGQSADVTLLWIAARPPSGDRVVFVQLQDKNGTVWASQESQPSEGTYPTSQWHSDESVRDIHTLLIPADAPDGTYTLKAGMYDPSGSPLTVLRLTRRSLDHVDLGTVEVRGRPRTQELPPLPVTVNARIGDVARLAGYGIGVGDAGRSAKEADVVARPGDMLYLKLVWQGMEPTRTSYTVFTHLLSPEGKVVGQDDTIPGRGTLPTTSWVRNEVLTDNYALKVPDTATPGLYQIEVGLYDATTNVRLPVWDANGVSVGDRLLLTKVRVDRAP